MKGQSNTRLRNLMIQLGIIQLLFFLILLFSSVSILEKYKDKIATAISIVTKEKVLNSDLYNVIIDTNKVSKDEFVAFQYVTSEGKSLFVFPNNLNGDDINRQKSLFQISYIEKAIQYDDQNFHGKFIFLYDRFEYFYLAMIFWLALFVLSIPFVIRAYRKVHDDIMLDLEYEKERFFGESAKKWAHDIKQLTEPMKMELQDMHFEDKEARETVFQSVYKIEQRILELLGYKNGYLENLDDFKHESRKEELVFFSYELKKLLKVAKRLYRKYEKLNIQFKEENLERIYILGNKDEFIRMVNNILTNSVEALDHKKDNSICISVTFENKKLILKISDTGQGIPDEIIDNIFEDSFTHGKETGTGKGLAQVKSFVEEHSGDLYVTSSLGKGTEIAIELKANALRYKSIIHIDDEELLRRSWKSFFKQRGVQVYSFSSPSEYLAFNGVIDMSSPAFIDSYMGDEIRGEDLAKIIYRKGYEVIYLATADGSHIDLKEYFFIKAVISKSAEVGLRKII